MDYIHNKQISAIIKDISSKIVTALSPDKIILFGSYADGEPSKDSDIDLLIIKNMRERPAERQRIISRLFFPRTIPLDIIVKTPTEIEKAQQRVDPFINGILKKGKVLYARS